jgi:hypothetical protein
MTGPLALLVYLVVVLLLRLLAIALLPYELLTPAPVDVHA